MVARLVSNESTKPVAKSGGKRLNLAPYSVRQHRGQRLEEPDDTSVEAAETLAARFGGAFCLVACCDRLSGRIF
jgi:hypothetical protein